MVVSDRHKAREIASRQVVWRCVLQRSHFIVTKKIYKQDYSDSYGFQPYKPVAMERKNAVTVGKQQLRWFLRT